MRCELELAGEIEQEPAQPVAHVAQSTRCKFFVGFVLSHGASIHPPN